jgi:competence protein ComEC
MFDFYSGNMRWIGQKVHVSWLIAAGCLTFVVGVWAALYVIAPGWVWIGAALGAVVVLWLRFAWLIPVLMGAALLLGLSYGGEALAGQHRYDGLKGSVAEVQGRVKEDPTMDKGNVSLQLTDIVCAGRNLPGSLWAKVTTRSEIKRGDIVTIRGVVDEGFGNFPATLPRASLIALARPVPGDVGRVVRDWFADAVRLVVAEPQASLGVGFLTGQKSALPEDLATSLQIAGLTHIVVASGYNLTILVRLARRLFMRVSKFVATLASGLMIASFITVTGLSPSMTRAGLVASLSLLAWYYGRKFHPFVLLPFAAAITVLWQPSFLWGDLGWQLSFSAFAGVMIVAPLLQKFFFGDKEPGVLRQVLGETVAAHFATIPIVVLAFGVLSNVAIPANLMIVPLVPLAMLLTFISGVAALAVPAIGWLVGTPTTWLLTYMTEVATRLSEVPWAQWELTVPWWFGIVYYALLAALCFVMWKVTRHDLRSVNLIE